MGGQRAGGLRENEKCNFNALHGRMDINKDSTTEVTTDASPGGLGAVITQYNPSNPRERHVVCNASRTLTDVERRFSQCERKL